MQKRHIQKSFEIFKFYCLNNNKCLLFYLPDKPSDVSLWLGQILVFSRFENTGIGATLRCSRNFFIILMVRAHKKQNSYKQGKSNDCSTCPFPNYSGCYRVLRISTNHGRYMAAMARTFVMNGTELCAAVFVVGFVPDMTC